MAVLIKIMAAAVAGSILGLVIKKNSPESSLMLTIAIAAFAAYLALGVVSDIVELIKKLAETAGMQPAVLVVVLKTVGVAVITRFSSDICRDAGQSSLSAAVDFAGSVTALYIALPLFETVISMISSLI